MKSLLSHGNSRGHSAGRRAGKAWVRRAPLLAVGALGLGLMISGTTATADDGRVLEFINDPATSASVLAKNAGISQWRASLIMTYRSLLGSFDSLDAVDAVWGVGPKTMARIEAIELISDAAPKVTEDPGQLDEKLFSRNMLRYVFSKGFLSWENYPGLDSHRESASGLGLARARDLRLDGVRYQTWGTSFFNAPAAAYIHENLYPMEVFKEQVVDGGKTVSFPVDSVVVKLLFTEYVADGMHTVEAAVCNSTRSGCINRSTGNLRPGSMHTHKVGLVQIDIGTKRYPNWTWATYTFDPDGDPEVWSMVPMEMDGHYVQTDFSQTYYGPVDNPRSTCIACHQLAQFPPVSIGLMVNRNDHNQPHPGPYETSRGVGFKVDYIWEAAQALKQWERDHPDERLEIIEREEVDPANLTDARPAGTSAEADDLRAPARGIVDELTGLGSQPDGASGE